MGVQRELSGAVLDHLPPCGHRRKLDEGSTRSELKPSAVSTHVFRGIPGGDAIA